MSDRDDPATRSYRNPPIEHRFRKGVSGNTKGRPRKKRAFVSTKVDGQPGIGFEDRIKSLAIEEAYRLITIREGDRVERIPVIQAVLRKVAVAAANGNTRAQQNYLNLLIGAEADRRVATMELLKAAVDYKEHDWARAGSSPRRRPHRLRDWKYPDRWPGHGGPKAGAGSVARHVAKARTRVDGNQRADRVRSEQFKPAQATERVDEDRELRPRRRTEA
jgi:hypothetical protein